jgi:NADH:ubiquinone oxidoreductase subunit E
MSRDNRIHLARIFATLFAILTLGGIYLLLLDYIEASIITPIEKLQLKEMEEQVRTDAAVSPVLTTEQDRRTQKSLQRDIVAEWTRLVLIFSSSAFLVCVTWFRSYGEKPVLPKSKLVDLRSIPELSSDSELIDLEFEAKEKTEIDLNPVTGFVSQYGTEKEAAIPILQSIQSHYGYLPDEALEKVCELTEISPAQIAGTSSFYSQFRKSPLGDHIVKVCHGTACHVSGIVPITEEIHRHLHIEEGEDTDPSGTFTVEKVACLGCCSLAPVMMIDDETVGRLTPASACQSLNQKAGSKS